MRDALPAASRRAEEPAIRIRVVGVGTWRGDDAAGLVTAGRLAAASLPPGVEVETCERPAPDLLDALADAEAVVIVDALRSGGDPGRVRRVSEEELDAAVPLSSHGLGVASALALARALGKAPPRVEIVGIETTTRTDGELSAAAERGVAEAATLAAALVAELARGEGPR